MSGMTAVSGVEKFTDEMLAKNFIAITQGFGSIDNRLDMFDNWIRHLEGHVGELYEMAKTAAEVKAKVKVKTPSRVKPFLIGAVVGVVVYNYATKNRNKIETVVEKATEEAKQRFAESGKNEDVNGTPRV